MGAKSLLLTDRIQITDDIYVKIPSVGDVLRDEEVYYDIVVPLTSMPIDYMAPLAKMGKDFECVRPYELFKMLFMGLKGCDMSNVFGDLDTSDFDIYTTEKGDEILYSPKQKIGIDEFVYYQISDAIRKINLFKKNTTRPGNESAKKYLIDKALKKLERDIRRNKNKPFQPFLEPAVVALVNRGEFKYNFEQTYDMSLYVFNRSLSQIQHGIIFDNTMHGMYVGMIDSSKIKDKSALNLIKTKA